MAEKIVSVFCVEQNFAEQRVDKVLFLQFPNYSRSYFQDIIDRGCVLINDKPVKKGSLHVQVNDKITVNFPPAKEYDLTPKHVDFEVVDVNDDFVVINKPAGLVVHPSDNNKDEASLIHGMLHRFKDFQNFTDDQRPGVVHRIDRETSGLILVARNEFSQRTLISMFEHRQIHKTYLAVVARHPHKIGKIELPVGRDPVHRHKMSHKGIGCRDALTFFDVLTYYKDSSLLAVRIITGRTHQIRVHMAALGHGLVGDSVYGYKSKLIDRQALHAWKLSFEYNGKKFEYVQPVPEDMKTLLHNLKHGQSFK
ncbi:MAG: Pseudouridine synthase [candidate division TM6 bacterium GW2011_GWF2_37_49]|nr:MAG: Pseudouridine synthase [candidate division TM6 bacterium GW2011_GWF2_37_49]